MAFNYKKRADGGYDFFDGLGNKTTIENYTRGTNTNMVQLRNQLAQQGDPQSQRIVKGLPPQFTASALPKTPTRPVFSNPVTPSPYRLNATQNSPAPKVNTSQAVNEYNTLDVTGQRKKLADLKGLASRNKFNSQEDVNNARWAQNTLADLEKNGANKAGNLRTLAEDFTAGTQQGLSGVADIALQNQGLVMSGYGLAGSDWTNRVMDSVEKARGVLHSARDVNGNQLVGVSGADAAGGRIASGNGTIQDFATVGGKGLEVANTATMFVNPTTSLAKNAAGRGAGSFVKTVVPRVAKESALYGGTTGAQSGLQTYGQTGDVGQSIAAAGTGALTGAVTQAGLGLGAPLLGKAINAVKNSPEYGSGFAKIPGKKPAENGDPNLIKSDPVYATNVGKISNIDSAIARATANGDTRALEGLATVKAKLSNHNAAIEATPPQVGKTDGLRDVPIADFKNTDTTSWNEAIQNVNKGELSKTNGPVEVVLTKNGYKLVEGNHRAVQALNNGDTTIKAKIISKEGLDEIAKRDGPHIKMGMQDSYTQKQLDAHFSTPAPQVGKTADTARPVTASDRVLASGPVRYFFGDKQPVIDARSALLSENSIYVKQPMQVRKAIDAQITKDNPHMADMASAESMFPDGIPKVRPEDVVRVTGLSPRELGIPQKYIAKNAAPLDLTAVDYETSFIGNTKGELKMTEEDMLSKIVDAIEMKRGQSGISKEITSMRNDPSIIAKAKAQLDSERSYFARDNQPQPTKKDLADYARMKKNEELQAVAETQANRKAITDKMREEKQIKKANEVLPEYKTRQESVISKAFRSTRSIIERQGKSGKELADMLQGQRDAKELLIRDVEKSIPAVTKLKDKEFDNFIDATQGNAKPLNANVEKAISEWQSTHPQIRQRGLDAGLNIGDLGKDYYPHFLDYDKIYKDKNTYNAAINHLVTTGQAPSAEAAVELLGRARDISRNREFGNLEASRIVDLPFYDRTKASLASYLQGSADRITKAETFGKGDESALKMIKQIALEGGDAESAKNAFDVAVGAKKYSPTASNVSGGIRQYITTTRLGLGALTNVSQSVNTGVVTGHLRTLGAIFKQLDPKTRTWAADTGVISDSVIQDLRRGYGATTFGNKKVGKVVNAITAPGFATVEKFNRRVAATAGKDYALRLAQKGDTQTLRKLGVTGDIGEKLTNAQLVQAARKIVEKTQFKVDAQDLPGWVDSPGGKLVAQFRTFSYSQSKFFSNEILKPAAKGNFMPLARVLAALPLGYGLYETRRLIDGRPEEDDKSKVALSSFSKIGGAGLALDIYLGMNPVGSKYLPSDRRVTMAVGTVGGPSAGLAAESVGSVSDAIQRKKTPADPATLDGKVVVANDGSTYNDLTSVSRFGMRQVPIVGTATANRVLPYKKQTNAETGTGSKGIDALVKANEERAATFKKAFSTEDYKLYNLSKTDRQKLVRDGTYTQEKVDGLMKYGGSKKKELGYDTGTSSVVTLPKTITPSAKSVLETYDTLDTEARKKWNTEKNTDTVVTDSLKSWLGKDVEIPQITNEVAKKWADYQKDYADGKISKLKMTDKKKAILRDAYNSQLSTDEKEIYNLSKAELAYYRDNGVINDENINNAIKVEKQLFEAGLISKETLQRNVGASARGYKASSSKARSSKSGVSKSRSGVSKTSIASILATDKSINQTKNDTYAALSRLLGGISNKTSKNKIGKEVTLKKITVKGAK